MPVVFKKVTPSLSGELWLAICAQLHARPHAVFRLMMGVRAANEAARDAPEAWWAELLRRALAHQEKLRHSNYAKHLRALARGRGLFFPRARSAGLLRAVFSPRCDACGARRGHRLLLPYAVRACGGCLRAQVVSNVALVARYGVRFGDFAERYCEEGGLLFYVPRGMTPHGGATVFLWRPHVERQLGRALQPLAGAAAAVALLWAMLQRARARHDAQRRRLLLLAAFDGGAAYRAARDAMAPGGGIIGTGRCEPRRLLALLQRAPRVKKGDLLSPPLPVAARI